MDYITKFGFRLGQRSDVGMEREINEDSYGYFEPPAKPAGNARGCLLLVCDGMGGAAAGDVASRMARDIISAEYYKDNGLSNPDSLVQAIQTANLHIYERQRQDKSLKGMGTTCVAAVIDQSSAFMAHVGDSRGYLIRDNKIFQITKDHSQVQEMVDRGWISKQEAAEHPDKNILDRVLGHKAEVSVDQSPEIPLPQESKILLCSDGLSNLVKDNEILQTVWHNHPQPACDSLIKLANERGGDDNSTVMIADFTKGITPAIKRLTDPPKPGRMIRKTAIIIIGILFIAGAFSLNYDSLVKIMSPESKLPSEKKTGGERSLFETEGKIKNIPVILGEVSLNIPIPKDFVEFSEETEAIAILQSYQSRYFYPKMVFIPPVKDPGNEEVEKNHQEDCDKFLGMFTLEEELIDEDPVELFKKIANEIKQNQVDFRKEWEGTETIKDPEDYLKLVSQGRKSFEIKRILPLEILQEGVDSIVWGVVNPAGQYSEPPSRDPEVRIFFTVILKNRIMIFMVYKKFTKVQDIDWARKAALEWLDRVIRCNTRKKPVKDELSNVVFQQK